MGGRFVALLIDFCISVVETLTQDDLGRSRSFDNLQRRTDIVKRDICILNKPAETSITP